MRSTQTCPEGSSRDLTRIAGPLALHAPVGVALRVLFAALILALLPGCGQKYDPWQPAQRPVATPAASPDRVDRIASRTQFSPVLSAVLVHGLFDLGFAAMVVSAITRARA